MRAESEEARDQRPRDLLEHDPTDLPTSGGVPMPSEDAYIAAAALMHDLIVVTRHVAGLARAGVRTVDPWSELT